MLEKILTKKNLLWVMMLLPLAAIGQTVNFIESPAPKSGSVFVPKEIIGQMPTADTYTLGYFIYSFGDVFQNVGQVELTGNDDLVIPLSRDLLGNNGYAEDDSLITLVRNETTLETFGIEFFYTNDAITYRSNYSDSIIGIKRTTWDLDLFHGTSSLCQFNDQFELNIPFGLKPVLEITPPGMVLSGYHVDVANSSMGSYNVKIISPQTWEETNFIVSIGEVDTSLLNASYTLCGDESVEIPATSEGVSRSPKLPTTTSTLYDDGLYFFTASYQNGCTTIDSIQVKKGVIDSENIDVLIQDEKCEEKGSIQIDEQNLTSTYPIVSYSLDGMNNTEPSFQSLHAGGYRMTATDELGCELEVGIFQVDKDVSCEDDFIIDRAVVSSFVEIDASTSIKVYDRSDQEVFSVTGPYKWKGTDHAGNDLPLGVYFIVLNEDVRKTVTIVD